jgi:hypothetical protein
MSKEMVKICDKEVEDLIRKRAITKVADGSEGFVCSLFVIPKKIRGI